jgi:hypothetical protein
LAGGNKSHMEHIKDKVNAWIEKKRNVLLSSSMGWITYKFQLWLGVRHEFETMTHDLKEAEESPGKTGYRMLNILGVTSTLKKEWRRIHSSFGGFEIFSFATEQLIERLNLLL